jgi:putative MATE family efflux protein
MSELNDVATPTASRDALSESATARAAAPPRVAERRFDRSIVEGPLAPAVWKLAWPTVLTNVIGGLQGMIDHAMVGNLVGFTANAAIGVSWQIFLVVIVFLSSMFMGMSVLVSRYVGAGNGDMADRTIYQAFLAVMVLSFGVLAPLGYVFAPNLLTLVNAAPAVQHEALPFLRIMFVFSGGMMIFFMTSGALRAAGDARTPMVIGVTMTVLNVALNVVLIRGLGPIPAFGTRGAAMGTSIASGLVGVYSLWRLVRGGWVVSFAHEGGWGPDWPIIRALFRFGLPTGVQGIAMNIGGVLLLSFIGSLAQSAASQAAYAVSYTELFSLVTWTSQGLLGATAAIAGQNLGAGRPDRAVAGVHVAARLGLAGAACIGLVFWFFPRQLLAIFGMHDPVVVGIGVQLLHVLSVSGLFISVALTYTGGLQGTGDTRSPLYISLISQLVIPLGIVFVFSRMGTLQPLTIWLAILTGHATRCLLSVVRFNQGKWRSIKVV